MPESKERDILVGNACEEWGRSDRHAALAFFKEQGIDLEEMIKAKMDFR